MKPRAAFVEHSGGARWFIMQGGNVPASTDLSTWLLFNSAKKLIISFTDQISEMI